MSSLNTVPTPPTPEEIEREKDKMDLRPAIDFIKQHFQIFEKGEKAILSREPSEFAKGWAAELNIADVDRIPPPQVFPEDARKILARMPEVLIWMSKLQTVDYTSANEVIVPAFNPDGTVLKGDWVPLETYERERPEQTRVLVGFTSATGEMICPSALPSSVYEDEALLGPEETFVRGRFAAEIYQLHVLMHEFFHTAEFPLRNPEQRRNVVLEIDRKRFTFQEWWESFENLILSRAESPVSQYAAGYAHDLSHSVKRTEEGKFTHAVAEQVCESFVAYQLNIISNDEGWTNFKEARPQTWKLMDTLCRARLVREDGNIDAL